MITIIRSNGGPMNNVIKAGISRRNFNKCLCATAIFSGLGFPAFGSENSFSKADGLIVLASDGKIHLYSGIGHLGLYGEDDVMATVTEVFNCDYQKIIIQHGDNPVQLPAVLGQCANHLSFSNTETTKKAALKLANVIKRRATRQFGGEVGDYHFENGTLKYKDTKHSLKTFITAPQEIFTEKGVSKETLAMIKGLLSPRIIVAVKSCRAV